MAKRRDLESASEDPPRAPTAPERAKADLATFEALRPELIALAYRMLGDVARAQDMTQEAWIRWHGRGDEEEVRSPKAYLVTIVTRLCLNDLDSARARREDPRADRLPEPVSLDAVGLDRLETIEHVSMAFLVVLDRLAPTERAVFLLHEIFDFAHEEIATLVGKSEASCRKLLERARTKIAGSRALLRTSAAEHEALLGALLRAVTSGDVADVVSLLAEDAVIVTDGGAEGRVVGRLRNLRRPLEGASRVAAFIVAAGQGAGALQIERRVLNGTPGIVFFRDDAPFAALTLGVAEGKVHRIFFHGDVTRLRNLGPRHAG